MMIAASVGSGMFWPRLPSLTRTTTIATAPSTPVSWVREPADWATAVRDADALTGNPLNNPAARFAAPSAMISWSLSTRSPRFDARLRDKVVVSASMTNAIPAAATSSLPVSWRLTSGKLAVGKPEGIRPTTDTPCAVRSKISVAMAEPTTATRIPGTLGSQWRNARITAREAMPTIRLAVTVSPLATPSTKALLSSNNRSALALNPKSRGSWLTSTTMAMPLRKPTRTGFESNSARMPARANPAITHMAPMRRASIPASATAVAGSPCAPRSGRIAATMSGPNAESGPSTSTRDGPKTEYASNATTVVYSPVTGGSPANSAYAMPWGTSNVTSTSAAITSPRSHSRRYRRATSSPGTCRVIAVGMPCCGAPSGLVKTRSCLSLL